MNHNPLVSIVTPTIIGREDLFWGRCLKSVMVQQFAGDIEHIVVGDRGTKIPHFSTSDFGVGETLSRVARYVHINESWRNPTTEASIGAIPWHVGSLLALGEYIGFLGDDDEFLPDHVERHVAAMENSGADFSISQIEFRAGGVPQFLVGDASFAHGHLDATGIMCRASALHVASWTANGENAADYRLVRDWIAAGLRGVFVGEGHTGIHHDGWLVGATGRPDRPGQ